MADFQPKLRLGSMETVFMILIVVVGLFACFSLVPLIVAVIWIVIPVLLTIGVIAAAVYAWWRLFRPRSSAPDI
jgi:hypothetical protein